MATVRTDPIKKDSVADAPAPPDGGGLKANEVRLSDGRVVALKRTSGLDDTRLDGVVFDAYANDMGIVPPNIYLRAQAMNGIMAIDGELTRPISTRAELERLLAGFWGADIDLIGDKYLEVMGKKQRMVEAIAEARQALRGDTFQATESPA